MFHIVSLLIGVFESLFVLQMHRICIVFVIVQICIVFFIFCSTKIVLYLLCIDHNNCSVVEPCTSIGLIMGDSEIGWLMSNGDWALSNKLCAICMTKIYPSLYYTFGHEYQMKMWPLYSMGFCDDVHHHVCFCTKRRHAHYTWYIVSTSSSSPIKDILFQNLLFKAGFITEPAAKRCFISAE